MSSHPPQEPPLAVTVARINPCQHFEMTRARESVWESACPAHRHPMPHFEPIGVYYNCTVVDDLMNKGDHYEEVYEALYKFTAVYKLPSPFCCKVTSHRELSQNGENGHTAVAIGLSGASRVVRALQTAR